MSDEQIRKAQREAFLPDWDNSNLLCYGIVRGVYQTQAEAQEIEDGITLEYLPLLS